MGMNVNLSFLFDSWQIRMGSGIFDKLTQALHDRRFREEVAENINFQT
jgi:hypothetical protein